MKSKYNCLGSIKVTFYSIFFLSEKLKSLLGSVNAETSCALFHAIKFNCIAAVKLICEHLQSSEVLNIPKLIKIRASL